MLYDGCCLFAWLYPVICAVFMQAAVQLNQQVLFSEVVSLKSLLQPPVPLVGPGPSPAARPDEWYTYKVVNSFACSICSLLPIHTRPLFWLSCTIFSRAL